jgi:hypothetical protein
MKKFYFVFFGFFTFQNLFFAQVLNLGTLVDFVLFTSNGAVSNIGISTLTGHVGADIGAISGFETSNVSGSFYNEDVITEQAQIDLNIFYNQLSFISATNSAHIPVFGNGEVLPPGVYLINAAGSLAGNLILDGEGDSSAVFLLKFDGAFTTSAGATVVLLNSATACNVYWLVEGAISMAVSTIMKGTMVSNNGAVTMASGGDLEGRLYSTTGAIAIDQILATKLIDCNFASIIPLPVNLLLFTASCGEDFITLNWSTASENNSNFFSVERSKDGVDWFIVGNVLAAGNSAKINNYSLVDYMRLFGVSYYRLRQTDLDGMIKYFSPISIENCFCSDTDLTMFPNPVKNNFKIDFKGNKDEIVKVVVSDIQGENIFSSIGFISEINLENVKDGIYFLHLVLKTKRINRKFIVLN